MSFKAKNLTVNSEEPAFLKRLRGEVGGEGERHTKPIARPKKALLNGDEEDDAPTYVDAETNDTLSKDEFERLQGVPSKDGSTSDEALPQNGPVEAIDSPMNTTNTTKREQVGKIGGASKRRIAKVVGEGEADGIKNEATEKSTKRKKGDGKKAKIKLSFDEDDD